MQNDVPPSTDACLLTWRPLLGSGLGLEGSPLQRPLSPREPPALDAQGAGGARRARQKAPADNRMRCVNQGTSPEEPREDKHWARGARLADRPRFHPAPPASLTRSIPRHQPRAKRRHQAACSPQHGRTPPGAAPPQPCLNAQGPLARMRPPRGEEGKKRRRHRGAKRSPDRRLAVAADLRSDGVALRG